MLLFFLPVLMGAECDPDQPIRSSFDNEFMPLRRDNVVASGFLYDEHDELPGYDYAAAVYLPSDVYQVETDLILEYQGGKLYSFYQDPTELPLSLQPAGNTNMVAVGLRRGPNEFKMLYSTILYMDPNVIVLPVYTWRLYSPADDVPRSTFVSARTLRYAFDRADSTQLPEEQWEALAGQWVDRVWSQCDIQFRHAGHFDVDVERCYTLGAVPAGEGQSIFGTVEKCFDCPYDNASCDRNKKCDCQKAEDGGNKCTVPQFIRSNQYFIPNAINIYFVWSFSTTWEYGTPVIGLTCGEQNVASGRMYPWIFVNTIRVGEDAARTMLPHEIGHILLNATSHEEGTLMQQGNHLLESLTADQCERARTTHLPVLSTKL